MMQLFWLREIVVVSEHNSESKSDRIRNNALGVTGDPVQPHVVKCVAYSLID